MDPIPVIINLFKSLFNYRLNTRVSDSTHSQVKLILASTEANSKDLIKEV